MDLHRRIKAFAQLNNFMLAVANKNESLTDSFLFDDYQEMIKIVKTHYQYNPWFTEEFIKKQFEALSSVCSYEKLNSWILPYQSKIEQSKSMEIGVILAGNIPFVGFHDFLSVLITGHHFIGKVSSKDDKLPKKIAEVLIKIEPEFKNFIHFADDKLSGFEAIIATGSNNTARYFEYYFGKVPNIIRKSRNSMAILNGNESAEELEKLADDILLYFGLGCRNISKIFVPENFNFDVLFKALYKYNHLINHNKYSNNYDYNRAIYLLNGDKFLDNGFFMIKEDTNLASPVSVLHYEYYNDLKIVNDYISKNKQRIQCIVDENTLNNIKSYKLGETQFPELYDYEDGINTLDFLTSL